MWYIFFFKQLSLNTTLHINNKQSMFTVTNSQVCLGMLCLMKVHGNLERTIVSNDLMWTREFMLLPRCEPQASGSSEEFIHVLQICCIRVDAEAFYYSRA